MKLILIILLSIFLPGTIAAQRQGEVPVPDRLPKTEATADSLEEDIYFILAGKADQAIADGDYASAEHHLVEAMAVDPQNPSNVLLLSNLGMVYGYMDRDSMALTVLDEANRRAPQMVTVLHNRARIHLKMGHDRDAYNDFSAIIERDSTDTQARYYHGMIALYSGDMHTAETDFKVLESLHPQTYETAAAMATLYSLSRRDKEAIPYYRRLIELDPAPEFYSALAGCHLALEQLSEAAKVIADGLKKYTDDPELYYYRAWLNRDRYLLDQAHADADIAIRLGADPDKVNSLFK